MRTAIFHRAGFGAAFFIVASHAFAAPPVTTLPASFMPDTLNPVPGTCDVYNGAIATGTQNPGGPAHPGSCRFADLDLEIEGKPASQYWQLVEAGTVPPPYLPVVSLTPFSFCVTAQNMHLHLSASVHASRLNWTDAPVAPQKPICAAEWAQHDPAGLTTSAYVQASVANFLQHTADTFNLTLAHAPPLKACLSGRPYSLAVVRERAQLAQNIANLLAHPLAVALAHWSGVSQTASCPMHCGLCASGWVGKITEQKAWSTAGQPNYYTETDTWLIGGQASNQPGNKIDIPVQWTAQGSGTYNVPTGGSKIWNTSASVAGSCPPNNVVCIEALTQTVAGGATTVTFSEVNGPITVSNAIQETQVGPTGLSSTAPYPLYEDTINGLSPRIVFDASQLPNPPAGGRMVTTCGGPSMNPGSSTCAATWTWQLAVQ